MKKRIVALVLALTMMCGMNVPMSFAASSFSDVPAGSWYYNTITTMADKGAIGGYEDGTFRPDKTITFAEFTKICVALLDGEQAAGDTWYENYLTKAAELGIIPPGVNASTEATKNISRANMAVMVELCAENVLNESLDTDDELILKIEGNLTDFNQINPANQDFTMKAYLRGLVSGMSAREFQPSGPATRAQAATMIARLTDKSLRVDNTKVVEATTESQNSIESGLTKYIGKPMEQVVAELGTPEAVSSGFGTYVFAPPNASYEDIEGLDTVDYANTKYFVYLKLKKEGLDPNNPSIDSPFLCYAGFTTSLDSSNIIGIHVVGDSDAVEVAPGITCGMSYEDIKNSGYTVSAPYNDTYSGMRCVDIYVGNATITSVLDGYFDSSEFIIHATEYSFYLGEDYD